MIHVTSLIVKLRILPTDAGLKSKEVYESFKNKMPTGMVVKNLAEEPIAFGLEASILDIQLEEKDGALEALEEAVRSSSLVSQVDVVGVSRGSAKLK